MHMAHDTEISRERAGSEKSSIEDHGPPRDLDGE